MLKMAISGPRKSACYIRSQDGACISPCMRWMKLTWYWLHQGHAAHRAYAKVRVPFAERAVAAHTRGMIAGEDCPVIIGSILHSHKSDLSLACRT